MNNTHGYFPNFHESDFKDESYNKIFMLKTRLNGVGIILTLEFVFILFLSFFFGTLAVLFNKPIENYFIDLLSNGLPDNYSFAEGIYQTVIGSDAFLYFTDIVLTTIGTLVPFLIFIKIRKKRFSDYFALSGKKMKNPFSFCIFAISASSLIGALSGFILDFLPLPTSFLDTPAPFPSDIYGIINNLLLTVVLVPFLEEFVYRGVILKELLPFGKNFAIIISALLFAAGHARESIGYSFVAGLLFAYAAAETGSLKITIFMHMANNIIVFLDSLMMEKLSKTMLKLYDTSEVTLFVVLGIIGLVLFLKEADFKDTAEIYIPNKNKCSLVFSTFILVYLISMILFNLV